MEYSKKQLQKELIKRAMQDKISKKTKAELIKMADSEIEEWTKFKGFLIKNK